jgi:uncharacterized protein
VADRVAPVVNGLNAPFWRGAAEGRLMLPHCTKTQRAFWPPSSASPFVTAGPVEWREAKPDGTVLAIAVYRRPFYAALAGLMPYAIGLVALDAGPRLLAHIANPDASGAVRKGDRVRIGFATIVDGGVPVPIIERIGEE